MTPAQQAQCDMELARDILSFIMSMRDDAVEREEASDAPDNEKIAKLKEEIEFYLQEHDAVIRNDSAAIERVMTVHYPKVKAAYDQHLTAPITKEERRNLLKGFNYACASVELERGKISKEWKERTLNLINSEINWLTYMCRFRPDAEANPEAEEYIKAVTIYSTPKERKRK